MKKTFFPVLITVIIIVIIIYLFVTIRQSNVTCTKTTVNDLDIKVTEKVETILDSNKISEIKLTKTIILPDKYLDTDKYLDSISYAIDKSYAYLGKDKYNISKLSDRLIVTVTVNKNEILILNNIDFEDSDDLSIKINTNTKSSDVITLKINDNYTEGELMTHLKNNGYICK